MFIAFSPNVGPIRFDCVLSEDHSSEIEITGNPIETGAEVNDHAYVKPKEVKIDVADGNAALTYNALVRFQESRTPFYMVTGLRIYRDMLVQSISATRDNKTNAILRAVIVMKQVLIVNTGVASAASATTGAGSSSQTAQAGGNDSRTAVTPSADTATDTVTADRAAGTVTRGDTPTQSVPEEQNTSLLRGLFG